MRDLIAACALSAALASAPAQPQAQSIHKCVAPGKPVSFQSRPCGTGETTVFVREYTPEPARPEATEPSRRPDATRAMRSRAVRTPRRGAQVSRDSCAGTKAQRDAWERNVGLKRTYDQLRSWNDRVARACN